MRILTIFLFSWCLWLLLGCSGNDTTPDTPPLTPGEIANPALAKAGRMIQEDPSDPNGYAQRAVLYYESEAYDEAIADLNEALRLDSTNVDYIHLLADVYLDYRKSYQALRTMEKAVSIHPQRIPTLLKLSEFQLILKQYGEGISTVRKILEMDPLNSEGHFMAGRLFEENGDTARALNSYQTAIENDPDLIDAWIKLGYLFASRNNPLAEQYFDSAVRVDSTNLLAWFAKAQYYHNQGRLPEAIAIYQKIIGKDIQYVDAYYNMGLAYLERDSIDQAFRQFDLAIKMDPTYVMAYYYRGFSHEITGDNVAAKRDYEQAILLAPGFAKAREALNRVEVQ